MWVVGAARGVRCVLVVRAAACCSAVVSSSGGPPWAARLVAMTPAHAATMPGRSWHAYGPSAATHEARCSWLARQPQVATCPAWWRPTGGPGSPTSGHLPCLTAPHRWQHRWPPALPDGAPQVALAAANMRVPCPRQPSPIGPLHMCCNRCPTARPTPHISQAAAQ
jgi:hypothetical protein